MRWKERYAEETEALKAANKELNEMKCDLSELRTKFQINERLLKEVRDEREMFKKFRDQLKI